MKDWLDSPSGHIAVCLLLIFFGCALLAAKGQQAIPSAHDIVVFALGALGRSMIGQNGQFRKPADPPKL